MISDELKNKLLSSFDQEDNITSLIENIQKLEEEIKKENDFLSFFCSYLIEKEMIKSPENVISIFEHIISSYEKKIQKEGILTLLKTDTLFFLIDDLKNKENQKDILNLIYLYGMVMTFDFNPEDVVGIIINLNLLSFIALNFNDIFNKNHEFVMALLKQGSFWDTIYEEYIEKKEWGKLEDFFSLCTPYVNDTSIQNAFMESLRFSAGDIKYQQMEILVELFDKKMPYCLLDILKKELKEYKQEKSLNSIYRTNPYVVFPATHVNETVGLMLDPPRSKL